MSPGGPRWRDCRREVLLLPREHRLDLWVKSGIPPLKAIQAATSSNARILKLDRTTGAIAEGVADPHVRTSAKLEQPTGDARTVASPRPAGQLRSSPLVYHAAKLPKWTPRRAGGEPGSVDSESAF